MDQTTLPFGVTSETPKDSTPEKAVTVANLQPVIIPPAPVEVEKETKFTRINLRETLCINGIVYRPGEGVYVPSDSEEIWGPYAVRE